MSISDLKTFSETNAPNFRDFLPRPFIGTYRRIHFLEPPRICDSKIPEFYSIKGRNIFLMRSKLMELGWKARTSLLGSSAFFVFPKKRRKNGARESDSWRFNEPLKMINSQTGQLLSIYKIFETFLETWKTPYVPVYNVNAKKKAEKIRTA